MSIALELEGDGKKLGKVCDRSYRNGPGCPLMLRESSEDLLTASAFGLLRRLRPALWLTPLLQAAFPNHVWPRLCIRDISVVLWKKLPPPPGREREGLTEVDVYVVVQRSVLLIESKYVSALSPRTTHDAQRDQLARLMDVAYGHLVDGEFFPRSPFVLVMGAKVDEPHLVRRYRTPSAVERSIPRLAHRSDGSAIANFLAARVGYASWVTLAKILERGARTATPLEEALLKDVAGYLTHKTRRLATPREPDQEVLQFR